MIAEKLDEIVECNVTPAIPESNSVSVIWGTDSLIPETGSVSLFPETDSPKAVSGNSESQHGHARSYSTGNISVPYKRVKILSRYLSASTGSCHDHCKYGTRLDLETKTPYSPAFGKKMEKQGKIKEIVAAAERKTKSTVNFTPSPNSKGQKPEFSLLAKKDASSPVKRETGLLKQHSLPFKGTVTKAKPMLSKSSTLPIKEQSCNKQDGEELDKEMGTPRIKGRKTSELDEKKSVARSAVSFSALCAVKKVFTRPIASLSPKRSGKRVSITDTEKLKNLKEVSHLKDRNDIVGVEPEDVPEKTLHVIESSATKNSDFSATPSSLHKVKSMENDQASSPLAQKILGRAQFGIHDSKSSSSPEKKSLKRFKQGTLAIRASISNLTSPKNKKSGTASEYHRNDNKKGAMKEKIDLKISPRKSVDKGPPLKNVSFRKGKVLELCPVINSPRKLKFKRKQSHSQIVNTQTIQSNLKISEVIVDDCETSSAKSECEKVLLKHQDVEEKKVAQNLLNNMIEATANRLAETRKSKVKVLVGAFETVISLQDSKPSSSVDAS